MSSDDIQVNTQDNLKDTSCYNIILLCLATQNILRKFGAIKLTENKLSHDNQTS